MGVDTNRFLAAITAVLICACLAACAYSARTPSAPAPSEPAPPEPSSMRDVESMIEPLEVSEDIDDSEASSSPAASSVQDDAQSATGGEQSATGGEQSATGGEQSATGGEQTASAVAQTSPAEAHTAAPQASEAETQSGAAELLPSVSTHKRLNSESIERELLRLVNEERVSAGAEPLGVEDNMQFAARIRAGEAITSFSHTRPNGSPYNTAFDEAGFSYAGKWHGENLASMRFTIGMLDENAVALEIFNSLKNSPGHYRNMVSDNFLQTGVGVAISAGTDEIEIASAQLFSSL